MDQIKLLNKEGISIKTEHCYHSSFIAVRGTILYDSNDTRKLIIQKVFISKPFRLPNGQMSKTKDIYVNAYELTVTIKGYDLPQR
jgi:hypothetical protein